MVDHYAIRQLINATWVLKYKQINQESIEILQYSRDDSFYKKQYPECIFIETEGRVVTHVRIDNYTYNVVNPQHIFSYTECSDYEASGKLIRDIDREDASIKVMSKEIADAMYRGFGSDSHYLFGIPPEHEKAVRIIIKLAIEKYKEVYKK